MKRARLSAKIVGCQMDPPSFSVQDGYCNGYFIPDNLPEDETVLKIRREDIDRGTEVQFFVIKGAVEDAKGKHDGVAWRVVNLRK